MNGHFRMSRWAIVLSLAVGAVVAGTVGYQFGVSHGLALGGQVTAAPPNVVIPYYAWHPWRFGFGGFFFPFLFFGFWLVILRGLFWGRPWRRGWHHEGPYDVPMRFDEWHRRAHDRMKTETTPPTIV